MLLKTATSLLALATAVLGHMEIIYPCPRYSPRCATRPTLPPGQSIDYNLNAPVGSNGNINAPICHHNTPWPQANEVWTAGQSVSVQFQSGGATHSGGHCEFSVSYDGGQTFVVLYQRLRYCFFTGAPSQGGDGSVRTYTFDLPANLPGAPRVTFLWSWVNAVGNREFYSNCADIAIKGAAGSYSGKAVTIANYGAGYPRIPEFLGNYETGISYYTNGTQITVSGPGYSGGGTTTSAAPSTTTSGAPTSTTSAAPSSTSSAPATSTTSAAPTSTTSAAPTSSTTSNPGSCRDSTYQCSSDKAGYQYCSGGVWGSIQPCSAGAVCYQSGTSIYCGWP